MARRVPTRKQQTGAAPMVDPTGRVDILAVRLLEAFTSSCDDFPLRALYGRFKPAIDYCLLQYLGPIKLSPPQLAAMEAGLAGISSGFTGSANAR
jgi:hypothetical protein